MINTFNNFQLIILVPLRSKKSGKIWETPWFCWESLHCDRWLSESLVRHHPTPFLLFEMLSVLEPYFVVWNHSSD